MKEFPRSTVGIMILNLEDEMILLNSPKWNGEYIIPCGHIKKNERIEDAVRREAREETGLKVYDLIHLRVHEFISPKQYHKKNLHFIGLQYFCRTKDKAVKLNHEATSYLWTPPQKALELDLESGTRETIEYYIEKNWNGLI